MGRVVKGRWEGLSASEKKENGRTISRVVIHYVSWRGGGNGGEVFLEVGEKLI